MAINQGYAFDPTKLSEKELNDYLQYFKTAVSRDRSSQNTGPTVAGYAGANIDTLQRIEEEMNKRAASAKESEERQRIMDIYGGGGGVSGGQSLEASLQASTEAQRKALEDAYAAEEGMGARTLTDYLGKQRRNLIEEASAGGGGGRRGYLTQQLANQDAEAGNAMSDYIAKLRAGKGQAMVGLEEGLQGRLLQGRGQDLQRAQSLSSLLQGGGQFQQSFGLERDKFGYLKGRDTLSDIQDQQALQEARDLGRLQAEASKPTGLQQFGQIAGGVGSLVGGIGGMAGGIGALKQGNYLSSLIPKKRGTAGVNPYG